MKKVTFFTVILAFLLFVGCGSDKKENETTDTGDTQAVSDTGDTEPAGDTGDSDTGDTDTGDTEATDTEAGDTDTGDTDTGDPVWEAKYQKADEAAGKVSEDVVNANNRLGMEIFSRLAKEEGAKNMMISPLSIAISMSMTANGADGDALAEMKEVLGFGEMEMPDVNEQFAQLIASLVEADRDMVFEIADSVWIDDRFAPGVKEDFISVLEDFYSAALFAEDLEDDATVGKINSWVSEQTHEKIAGIIESIPADTVMYLINAVYFEAGWKTPFDKNLTQEGKFTLSDGSTKQVGFMRFTEDLEAPYVRSSKCYYDEENNLSYTIVRIPYGRDVFAFYGIIPTGSLDEFITKTAENDINSYFKDLYYEELQLTLPKFGFAYEKSLKDTFSALGIGKIFEGGLKNISDVEDLRVSGIYHKTFIEVNEEGATAGSAAWSDPAPAGDILYFFGDKPFIFMIRDDRTGSILFMGKVEDPTEE